MKFKLLCESVEPAKETKIGDVFTQDTYRYKWIERVADKYPQYDTYVGLNHFTIWKAKEMESERDFYFVVDEDINEIHSGPFYTLEQAGKSHDDFVNYHDDVESSEDSEDYLTMSPEDYIKHVFGEG